VPGWFEWVLTFGIGDRGGVPMCLNILRLANELLRSPILGPIKVCACV
jgi:hypothetical protein